MGCYPPIIKALWEIFHPFLLLQRALYQFANFLVLLYQAAIRHLFILNTNSSLPLNQVPIYNGFIAKIQLNRGYWPSISIIRADESSTIHNITGIIKDSTQWRCLLFTTYIDVKWLLQNWCFSCFNKYASRWILSQWSLYFTDSQRIVKNNGEYLQITRIEIPTTWN